MRALLIWMLVAQGLDIGTTAYALHHDCRETILWPSHPHAGLTFKAGAAVTLAWGAPRLDQKKPRLAKWLVAGVATSGTFGAAWNAGQIARSCH